MEAREFVKGYKRMCKNTNYSSYPPIEDLTDEEIIKVEKWIKEHPVMTNAMKYKKVFGVEPKSSVCRYICPPPKYTICSKIPNCEECRKWWDEEYKEPEHE